MRQFIWYSIILFVGIVAGVLICKNRLIDGQLIRDHFHFRKALDDSDESWRKGRVMVFLAFGQSNAANYGEGTYQCRNDVYNFYNGNIYKAEEPLLGADGKGSSVWTRVADLVIDSGLYDRVLIVPCGIGQTPVRCWSEGQCRNVLESVLEGLKKKEIDLTHIFWLQGETDNVDRTSKDAYKQNLYKVIRMFRNTGVEAPFYVSLVSFFPYNNNNRLGVNDSIRKAQVEVIEETPDVLPGPDVDELNLAYHRYDAVHFTEYGLDSLAKKWYTVIKQGEHRRN